MTMLLKKLLALQQLKKQIILILLKEIQSHQKNNWTAVNYEEETIGNPQAFA